MPKKKPKRKRGRPKEYENLDAYLKLYYPKQMEEEVNKVTKEMGISKSEFVRRAIENYMDNKQQISEVKEYKNGEIIEFTDSDISILKELSEQMFYHGMIDEELYKGIYSLAQATMDSTIETFRLEGLKKLYSILYFSRRLRSVKEFKDVFKKLEHYLIQKGEVYRNGKWVGCRLKSIKYREINRDATD